MAKYVRPEIERIGGYTPGEQPQAGKFIKINTNENPYPCSSSVGRAVAAAVERGLQRYPDPTAQAFRVRAGEVLGFPPEWILAGNGSDDILTICTRAFVGQGDKLRLPYPSYILYRTLAQLQGARWEEVSFDADWRLPEAFGASTPGDGLKLVFLPNPNSPSGSVVPPDEIEKIAKRLPCPILVDEAYVDFADVNCLELVRRCDNVLVSRTLSKSYALAGLRFGFVVARPELIDELAKVKDSYNCDALSIAGATAAIDDQAWLVENRSKIVASRSKLERDLVRLGFEVIPSQANFVWCKHPGRPSKPIYEQLKAQRVLVRYMNYDRWSDGLRISVGTEDQMDALVLILEGILG